MIEDTTYNLNLRLQRIDDKIALLPQKTADSSDTSIDLNNERAVTERCLSICENARSYLGSLTDQEPLSQPKSPQDYPMDQQETFEAQRLTRQLLGQNRDSIAEMVGRLRERLESIPPDGNPANGHERTRLQQELNLSKQCLEICKMASVEVTRQKCHTIGEAIADGDSDQVLVTTFADLFNIGKAESRGKSAQLIGSMRDETLQRISDGRYGSRFGALPSTESGAPLLQSPVELQRTKEDPPRQETAEGGRSMATRPYKPNSYQVRSRRPDGRAGIREEGEE